MFSGAIDQRVLVDPADASRIRTECWRYTVRQSSGHLTQVFENPGTRPVKVRAILKNDVNEGIAKKRVATYCYRFGYRQHCRRQRIGHLVLDHLRGLSRKRRLDDDLNIRKVRQRIDRCLADGVHAPGDNETGCQQYQDPIVDRPANQASDH